MYQYTYHEHVHFHKMNLLSEFGTDFPVSGGLKNVFDKCRQHKKVKKFIRTLISVCYLYEDNTILVIPLSVLQTTQLCRVITDFLSDTTMQMPMGIYYAQISNNILDCCSIPGDIPKFLFVQDNLTLRFITISEEFQVNVNTETIKISGNIVRSSIHYPYIVCQTRSEDGKYNIYATSLLNMNKNYSIQCQTETESDFYIYPPTLYSVDKGGIKGCSFDETGQRQFPRKLNSVLEAENLIHVNTLSGFYVFDRNSVEIIKIQGKTITRMKLDDKVKNCKQLFVLGPYIFCLLEDSIITLDFISGELKSEMNVPKTEEWLVSLEKSYGAVCIGEKSFSISRTNVPPLINLFASPSELKEELKIAKEATGTVATPIILMANRSPYLAATMMKDEIEKEISSAPPPGSMKEFLRPSLLKIHKLLQEKP